MPEHKQDKQKQRKVPFYRKRTFLWITGSIVGVVLLVLIAFAVSPWPGAMVIRYVFSKNDVKTTEALEKHAPTTPITLIADQKYRSNDGDALLDVYFPESIKQTDKKLPVVIWTHGGAWVSGGKADNATYYKLIASQNYTVISVDYTLGPEKKYPTAVHQLNDMYAYVQKNASRFHADTDKIFLAGDSAGSQLSSQMATIITSPHYAKQVGVSSNLKPTQLKGVILNCGIYKMDALIQPDPSLPKIIGWGDDVSIWAYTGSRDRHNATLTEMSAMYHATKDFPATYISGGNADPLTDAQAKPFAQKLQSLGVDVTTLFYPEDHQPELPHEYQFNLDNQDGQNALTATLSFIKKHSQ